MEEREALIALNMMEGIGPVKARCLATVLGSYSAIFEADMSELCHVNGIGKETANSIISQRKSVDTEEELRKTADLGGRIVSCNDPEYPKQLLEIHDPPLALYVAGTLCESDRRAIAVVGTRRPTAYGRQVAETLSYQLSQAGCTIASGLARGIDTWAHRGALKGGGRTIAVIGSALDCLYPAENRQLAQDISRNGAVISEFPLGKRPDKTTFPMRNRIVSGLSMGVLVVEANKGSGALITANQGLEQGRSVFAVPGRIDSPPSRGTHSLIKTGATLVEGIDDILGEFEFLIPKKEWVDKTDPATLSRQTLLPDEARLIGILEDGPMDMDSLTRAAEIKPSAVSSLLIGLEMKRIVRILPGRTVELVKKIG